MKALFLTPSLGAGGAERQLSLLLPGLRERGIDARALALDAGGPFVDPLRDAGVPVEVLAMRHQADLAPLVRSPIVRRFAADVIVSRGVSGLYIGRVLAGLRRAAHLYDDHRGVGVSLSRRRAWMLGFLARGLDAVIVVSPDQRESWLRRGCRAERVLVIRNGVPPVSVDEPAAAIRATLGVAPEAVLALVVASLKPVKRVPDFVAAVRLARAQAPQLTGVIAGDGPERGLVERVAAGDPAIRVLGYRDDVARLLHAADVLVLCSAHEALPMSILEGMSAGLPVVATRVGAIPDLLGNEEAGLLLEPGDVGALAAHLVRLSTDTAARQAMGAAARESVTRRWSAEAMIERYAQTLEDAAAWTTPRRR